MILGGTLSQALSSVLKEVDVQMTGWYLVPAVGWGDSKRLMSKLKSCPRSVHHLQSALRHSASGPLFALHLSSSTDSARNHENCSRQRCDARNGAMQSTCWMSSELCKCKSVGLDLGRLLSIIRQGRIPLFTYDSHQEKITVNRLEKGMTYTIVSHVWSDGLGNSDANELPLCPVCQRSG